MYLASAIAAVTSACSGTDYTQRTVTLHAPLACSVPEGTYAVYEAHGDFQPTLSATGKEVVLTSDNTLLSNLPAASRSLTVQLSDSAERWVGVGAVPDDGPVDVLLWHVSNACGLTGTIPAAADPAFGAVDSRFAIVSGGRPLSVSVVPSSWVIDLRTGAVSEMANGPLTVRERATITKFGEGALLAGGVRSDDPNGIDNTAELWDAKKRDFDGMRIQLSASRAEHGAVELASGDVLLVGGIGSSGKPLGAMEIVTVKDRRSISSGLPVLEPRTQPTVLRLASGEILVAGGKDANGNLVAKIEILSSDARKVRSIPFLARAHQAFVALDGGGALVLLAPDPMDAPTFASVWRLTADGALLPLGTFMAPLSDVRLFPASGGGAIVWTGSQWGEFVPWTENINALPLSAGPGLGAPAITPASGLPLWLSTEGGVLRVTGRLFSVRDAFATEILPLAGLDRGPIAPDRSPLVAGMTFDPAQGLFLPDSTAVFVADGRYRDFIIDATLPSGGVAPVVVLRDASGKTYELGGADCPLNTSSGTLHVERVGAAVGSGPLGAMTVCTKPIPFDRVAIGFRGQGSGARIQSIRVRRAAN